MKTSFPLRNWDEMIGSGPCRILVKNGKKIDPKYRPLHPPPEAQQVPSGAGRWTSGRGRGANEHHRN